MATLFEAETETYSITLPGGYGSNANFSLTCWIRLTTDRDTWQTPWCFGDAASGDVFQILQTSDTGTSVVYISSAAFDDIPIVDIAVNTWYYFGVSMSGTTGTVVYRTDATSTFTSVAITNQGGISPATFQIGSSIYGEWWNGAMTGVKWWRAALTETELEAESNYLEPVRTTNLYANYNLVSPSTTDDSGNGHTLTGGTGASQVAGPAGVLEAPVASTPFRGWGVPVF